VTPPQGWPDPATRVHPWVGAQTRVFGEWTTAGSRRCQASAPDHPPTVQRARNQVHEGRWSLGDTPHVIRGRRTRSDLALEASPPAAEPPGDGIGGLVSRRRSRPISFPARGGQWSCLLWLSVVTRLVGMLGSVILPMIATWVHGMPRWMMLNLSPSVPRGLF
jgi:hypothetical protein